MNRYKALTAAVFLLVVLLVSSTKSQGKFLFSDIRSAK